jgi:aminodeoxyfutalosine deaminase
MAYRILRADRLFDGYAFREGTVLIIDEAGVVKDLLPETEAPDAEYHPGILLPGFINAHCHLELSHMKGKIPEGTGLVDFVAKVVVERHADEETILEAVRDAVQQLQQTGTVAVGDICNNPFTIPAKLHGGMDYYNFIEVSGWVPEVADARLQRSLDLLAIFKEAALTAGLVPHAPYSVSERLWNGLSTYFTASIVTIHNQESAEENKFFLEGKGDFERLYEQMGLDNSHHEAAGVTSLQHYFSGLKHARHRILVHNTFTTAEDLEHVRSSGTPIFADTFFCLCPNANLYIEKALPPVELLQAAGCAIVIGTDSLASNHALSIPSELQTLQKHFPSLALEDLLRWATSNGARALGMEEKLGSFEKGKQPGVLLLEAEHWKISLLAN